jgi:hypothetical protein
MSDDLIKRDDALATIDTFKRNFEQPWKVQFSADIRALPAVDRSERIEQLNERLTAATDDAKEAEAYAEQLEAKLTKAVEALRPFAYEIDVPAMSDDRHISVHVTVGDHRRARATLAELEGK